jgi:hypothetical protein
MTFRDCVEAAWQRALADQVRGEDGGELHGIHELCRRGVRHNWSQLTAERFLPALLWCVGSVQKDYAVRLNFWDGQLELFRDGDPLRIARERDELRAEWLARKCYLNRDMVEAVIEAATKITLNGWNHFRERFLVLPDEPQAETPAAWEASYWALRELPQVGDAIAWYLIRNLYGGPFFKPDIHIDAVARHFFGTADHPIEEMANELRCIWPEVCTDPTYLPLHMGELDYVLWWYRRNTGLPPAPAAKTA